MQLLADIAQGFAALGTLATWLALIAGALLGIVVGVLPGVGPGVMIAILLPFTYGMAPLTGVCLLLGIYCGAFYGGAVTSILVRTPGEASSIMTMLDGHPMARRGEAARALSLAFMSAFAGGIVSAVLLGVAARPLAALASRFGAAETAMAIIIAGICVAFAYRRQFPAAMMMMGLGFFATIIGIDPNSNELRYTFGQTGLLNGLPLVPVAVGLFGAAQALVMLSSPRSAMPQQALGGARLSLAGFREALTHHQAMAKGLGLGTLIGVLPAVGAALSTSLAWFWARRGSRDPQSFGQGNPEGIVAAESANSSNSGGAMITVLALGIPGDAITAIIMGVFIVHGIAPGPSLYTDKPELVNGIFVGLLMLNVLILACLVALVRPLARLAHVDPRQLALGILALSFVGAYTAANSTYYLWIMLAAAVFGWLCARAHLPTIPLILGMVMGDTLEAALRQALTISDGSLAIFVTRPGAALMLAIAVIAAGVALFGLFRARARRANT
ncbi:MAG: hypothetical protein FJY37_11585 [Betaproteobacteria bacterium]|nr:hypothetical protein [Betaproteobacteria bacterium]